MKKILLYGFKYIFKYKTLYFVYFASQILISLSELFIPIMEGAVIDSLVKTDLNIFIKNIIVLILIMLFSLAFSIIGSYLYFLLQVWVFHGGGATQSMKIEPPNPFGQSHAIHCSEPLNPRREPLSIYEMTLIFCYLIFE